MENGLLKKLLFKPGFRILVANTPENLQAILGDTSSIEISEKINEPHQGMLFFAKNSIELDRLLADFGSTINDQIVWIAYPKKNSGIETDLKMEKWAALELYKLTPCASAAIDEIWTGLRIKPIAAVKTSGVGNNEIKNNSFAEFIDVENKKVTAPPDLDKLLIQHPEAKEFFESLAYSHKKEYVLWILTAKQEKTKVDRLEKTLAMLKMGKKNPTMK
ncbi:YdeI/OmpD-associated family protein [Pedobacter nyackensis]|uniref:YdeI/OmpD-associated family protein n=1 Tax=Pedobacter nyackensis TaxID=475255 RepID=UPI002931A996|nr:YdeI/OmpD-associated family protein [Pedobacter nyackensis]